MKNLLILIGVVVLVAAVYLLFIKPIDAPIGVTYQPEVTTYSTSPTDSAVLVAQMSDDAEYAKVTYAGDEYELMRTRSASGVKYQNSDASVVFWEQGGEAILEVDGEMVVQGARSDAAAEASVTETFTIAPERQPCTGVGPQECLIVNGEFFYDAIDGFEFEPGYEYVLEVERTERENVPADASAYTYTLVEVVRKTAVDATASSTTTALSGDWQWVETQYNNDTTVTPDDTDAFTLSFSEPGRVAITTDCNNGSGSYTTDGSQVSFGPIAATKMACLNGSQETEFFAMLEEVQSYLMVDGDLILELPLDTGVMVFSEVE